MEKRNQNTSSSNNNTGSNPVGSQQQQQSPAIGASSAKKTSNIPASDGPAVRSRNSGSGMKKSTSSNSQGPNGSSTFNENDTFNKHYNKELRVSKDEIPIVLAELNDSAIAFIKREQYEKALNLLQKAYGIMDVVEFDLCRRDKFHLFILFHNMALCYQKMQMLDECSQCIEQALEFLPLDQFNLQEKSISNRMRKLQIMGKLKMQYCAILSQVHRHKDALDQAKEGVRLSHLLINDMKQLCEFYIKREEIEQSFYVSNNGGISRNDHKEADMNYNSYYSGKYDSSRKANSSRNRSFSQFLSQQEAYQGEDLKPANIGGFHKRNDSFSNNLSSFYSLNYLEETMSFIEKTARKLLPILVELKKKMIPEKQVNKSEGGRGGVSQKGKIETLESLREDLDSDNDLDGLNDAAKKTPIDMKNILGYLNQGEWTQTLSIGSIMQLQPFTLKDLLEQGKNELELTRDSFIGKVSFLAVAYFCYSTEIRFILQMKEDPTWEPTVKQKESEYWHAKSLEVACTFLPGECPLLNHINLSYQKHFAPVKTTILEDEANNDDLIVVKPLQGIENPKFQPIIRQVQNIHIAITPYSMTPINQIANQFLSQMISFNDYQEQQVSQNQVYGTKMQHQKSKSGDMSSKSKLYSNHRPRMSKASYDPLIEEDLDKSHKNQKSITTFDDQDDLKRFEELFEKLMKENKLDKIELLKKLKTSQDRVLEEGDSSQFNDLLLDEHILAEESIDEQIAMEAKHQNSNSINLYKFRAKESLRPERPKTSHSIHRGNNSSIGDHQSSELDKDKSSLTHDPKTGFTHQQLQQLEDIKKRSQRPLSGGLQKIKNESHRSRINKMNQNYSMYDKFGQSNTAGSGFSPEKNLQYQSMNVKNQNSNVPSMSSYQNNALSGQSYSQSQLKKSTSSNQNKSFDAYQKLNYVPNSQQIAQTSLTQQPQTTILDKKNNPSGNMHAYDELKRRLLNEYKKLTSNKKTFDDQVREKYKNLKQQRAVSGGNAKKSSSNSHQLSGSISQQQPLQPQGANNLSPKAHLNVYKPTFIINNSFGEGSNSQGSSGPTINKEVDAVDQINKKQRPSSKSGSNQHSNSQTQIQQNSALGHISSGRQVVNQNSLYHERQSSQYTNNHNIQNSQQLMGLLMNADKKNPANSNGKKSMKAHALSQNQQDLSFVKQLLTDKTNNGQLPKHQHQPSYIQSSTGTNFAPSGQLQYSTQSQFNPQPQKVLMAQLDVKKPGSGSSTGVHKKQAPSQQIPQTSAQQQKLAAYEKLKKKLSYQPK